MAKSKTYKKTDQAFKDKHGYTIEEARFVHVSHDPAPKVKCQSCAHDKQTDRGMAYCDYYKKTRMNAYLENLKPKGRSLDSCPKYKPEK